MTAKVYSNWFAMEIDKKGSAVVVVQCFNEHLEPLDCKVASELLPTAEAEAQAVRKNLEAFYTGQHMSCRRPVASQAQLQQAPSTIKEYFSIAELAERWRCSRATVYRRLRALGTEILDFSSRGKKGRKVVRATTVSQIERTRTRRFR
jgi:biotin operon repressor